MNPPRFRPAASPWHDGERRMQATVGDVERMENLGRRVIRDHMPEQHRHFFEQLPFLIVGAVDARGRPWASLLAGEPGFLASPDPRRLVSRVLPDRNDPARAGLEVPGQALGLLGIDLATRRRNRMNGSLIQLDAKGFEIAVHQSFGNCPQYIQRRSLRRVSRMPAASGSSERLERLDADAQAMIRNADTFFVASYADLDDTGRQVDVSHRGGRPGFVRIGDGGRLTIPDFAGNGFFNTLGNLLVNPRAGLLFVDFENGDLLQLSGAARVVHDSPELADFAGAERLWTLTPECIVRRRGALPLRFDFRDFSPNALSTGSWSEAALETKAPPPGPRWRPFRIERIEQESEQIRSFYLRPADDATPLTPQPGQHLPIRLLVPGAPEPLLRHYSLTSGPEDDYYRISVKRDGRVSRHLHDRLRAGDLLEALPPSGRFLMDPTEERPAVFLAAGIGITPMLSMLKALVDERRRGRQVRRSWLFYGARTRAQRAFDDEIEQIREDSEGALSVVHTLSAPEGPKPVPRAQPRHVDLPLLQRYLPFGDYDFYLCGPANFMQGLYDGLRGLSVADARIHTESFGPARLERQPDPGRPGGPPPARVATPVRFRRSGKQALWRPGSGSLLELAESCGLQPEHSCRSGACGSCRVSLIRGQVAYLQEPGVNHNEAEVLICCAAPAAAQDDRIEPLELDL